MPLETRVEGDPDNLLATASWVRQQKDKQHASGDQISGSRNASGSWQGQAGEGFRGVAGQLMEMVNTVTGSADALYQAMQTHASDLRWVKGEMARALQVAHDGGLTVSGTVIEDPGPAPPPAAQRPPGSPPPTSQEQQAAGAAQQAGAAYQKKVQAFAEASKIVEGARNKENESKQWTVRFLKGLMDPAKMGLTLGNMSTSMATHATNYVSKWTGYAKSTSNNAAAAANLADNPNMSQASRTKAMILQVENKVNADEAWSKANATRATRSLQKVPDGVRNALNKNLLPDGIESRLPSGLKTVGKVGSKIPYVGVAFTAAGIGSDALQGKDVGKSAVSGTSSLVAGSVVGTAIGGPVGTVVGGLVGIGVGFAADEVYSWFQ